MASLESSSTVESIGGVTRWGRDAYLPGPVTHRDPRLQGMSDLRGTVHAPLCSWKPEKPHALDYLRSSISNDETHSFSFPSFPAALNLCSLWVCNKFCSHFLSAPLVSHPAGSQGASGMVLGDPLSVRGPSQPATPPSNEPNSETVYLETDSIRWHATPLPAPFPRPPPSPVSLKDGQ